MLDVVDTFTVWLSAIMTRYRILTVPRATIDFYQFQRMAARKEQNNRKDYFKLLNLHQRVQTIITRRHSYSSMECDYLRRQRVSHTMYTTGSN